jgi:hypothetical protein
VQYLMMIYTDEKSEPAPGTKEFDEMFSAYLAFSDEVKKGGKYVHSAPLQPVATATTVRVRNGKTATTDGPFAETKEQLGGFYLLDCKDLDEAVELAAKIPGARLGSVEVRPIMVFERD